MPLHTATPVRKRDSAGTRSVPAELAVSVSEVLRPLAVGGHQPRHLADDGTPPTFSTRGVDCPLSLYQSVGRISPAGIGVTVSAHWLPGLPWTRTGPHRSSGSAGAGVGTVTGCGVTGFSPGSGPASGSPWVAGSVLGLAGGLRTGRSDGTVAGSSLVHTVGSVFGSCRRGVGSDCGWPSSVRVCQSGSPIGLAPLSLRIGARIDGQRPESARVDDRQMHPAGDLGLRLIDDRIRLQARLAPPPSSARSPSSVRSSAPATPESLDRCPGRSAPAPSPAA